jgi:TPR repeat protein
MIRYFLFWGIKMEKTAILIVAALSMAAASFTTVAKTHKNSNYFCETDCKMEFKFFRQYAKEGSSLANLMLAIMYYQGKGTDVDSDVGTRYLLKAARAGEPGAQYQLGYFLMHGVYMQRDLERALVWLKRAEKNNKKGATEQITRINQWQSSGDVPASKAQARVVDASDNKSGERARDADGELVEVVTVWGSFSYSQVLEAAKDQTCNASCPPQWIVVMAPLIVLSGDDI